ncbi:MAG: FAD-dependent oxidoreductase [Myxococcota bacterium]
MAYDYDLVVLGSGPAGEKGAAQAAYFKKRVAVIEVAPEPGGACVHTGTLPSKTLREAALFLSGWADRELYGIHVDVDRAQATPRMLSRKEVVRRLEVERIRWNLDRHQVTSVFGHGRFLDPHRIEVRKPDGSLQSFSTEFALIATGSEPFHPSNVPFSDPDVDDSDSILQIDRLPDRMVVLGAGVIGCEYACMFAALGVKVTLVEARDALLPFLDREVAAELASAMQELGVELLMSAKYEGVERTEPVIGGSSPPAGLQSHGSLRTGPRVLSTRLAGGRVLESDKLLYCAGRNGRTGSIGLENIGVTADKRGAIPVNEHFQTTTPNVYAVGDCIGFPALASVSMEQGRVAMVHAFQLGYKQRISPNVPYGLYTIPEVSFVGLTEEEAKQQGLEAVVGRAFLKDNTRGKIRGDKRGFVKLVFDKQKKTLLGVHCVGGPAAELVHIGHAILTLGGGVDTLIDMVFNHPTLAESYKYAAYDALGRWGSS